MYLYTQTANINFITVRINYLFNSQSVNMNGAEEHTFSFPSSYAGETEQKTAGCTGASSSLTRAASSPGS